MDVACSTFCFDSEPLEQALRHIADLEFSRVDLGISPKSNHVRPDDVLNESAAVVGRMRQGPTIGIAGITLRLDSPEAYLQYLGAASHFAKQAACAILTI